MMKGFHAVLSTSALALAIAATFTAGEAQAVTQGRVFATNPTGICQSALPVFDGQIRKRPRALQNEGDSSAFITCSFSSQGPDGVTTSASNATSVTVYFVASDSVADSVSCTGVPGWAGHSSVGSVKTVAVTSSSSVASITWLPADFGVTGTLPTALFSISCNLNPGVGIADSYIYFNEDVGT